MINNIRKFVNFIATKENSGETLTPEQFNLILPVCHQELFNIERTRWEATQVISDVLGPFEVVKGGDNVPLRVDNGFAEIPQDYMYHSSMYYKRIVGSKGLDPEIHERPIEVLTDAQFSSRLGSYIVSEKKWPYCTYRTTKIEFRPKNIDYVHYAYLKKPIDPVLDYYINSSGGEVFLDVGENHTWKSGEFDSSGNSGNVGNIYTSKTVDVQFEQNAFLHLARLVLMKVGINLKYFELTQFENQFKQQAGNE